MNARADERPYEQPAPETGPAVTSANLKAEAEKAALRDDDAQPVDEPKKPTTKRGTKNN